MILDPVFLGELLRMAVQWGQSETATASDSRAAKRLVRTFTAVLPASEILALSAVVKSDGPDWRILKNDLEMLVMTPAEGSNHGIEEGQTGA